MAIGGSPHLGGNGGGQQDPVVVEWWAALLLQGADKSNRHIYPLYLGSPLAQPPGAAAAAGSKRRGNFSAFDVGSEAPVVGARVLVARIVGQSLVPSQAPSARWLLQRIGGFQGKMVGSDGGRPDETGAQLDAAALDLMHLIKGSQQSESASERWIASEAQYLRQKMQQMEESLYEKERLLEQLRAEKATTLS
jgi:hypothetical protein